MGDHLGAHLKSTSPFSKLRMLKGQISSHTHNSKNHYFQTDTISWIQYVAKTTTTSTLEVMAQLLIELKFQEIAFCEALDLWYFNIHFFFVFYQQGTLRHSRINKRSVIRNLIKLMESCIKASDQVTKISARHKKNKNVALKSRHKWQEAWMAHMQKKSCKFFLLLFFVANQNQGFEPWRLCISLIGKTILDFIQITWFSPTTLCATPRQSTSIDRPGPSAHSSSS